MAKDIKAISMDLWFTLVWEDDEGASSYTDRRVEALYRWLSRYRSLDIEDVYRYYRMTDHVRMVTPIPRLMEYICVMAGVEVDGDLIERMARDYIRSTWDFKPKVSHEAPETLKALRDRGFRIGVLTNTSFNEDGVWRLLDNVGLSKYIDVVVSSCDIGVGKPLREAFEYLCIKMGVGSSSLLHVGDTYLDDVVGARLFGAEGVLYTGLWKYYDKYTPYRNRARDKVGIYAKIVDDLRKLYIDLLDI